MPYKEGPYLHLSLIADALLDTGHKPPKPLRYLERVEKPFSRPPTPCVTSPSEAEEEKELAVVLLQRVVRGRAIQNKVGALSVLFTHFTLFIVEPLSHWKISQLSTSIVHAHITHTHTHTSHRCLRARNAVVS